MSAVYDWSVPFLLTSPFGTLALNQEASITSGLSGYYLLEHKSCASGAELRVSRDDVPQGSGEIQHLHYKSGYEMRVKLGLWETIDQPACDDLLVAMGDLLQLHLNALLDDDPVRPLAIVADPFGLTRIQWTPAGAPADRMLNPLRLLERPAFAVDEETTDLVAVTFAVMSDRPYAMDAPQVKSCLGGPLPAGPDAGCSGANPLSLFQGGTTDFFPVIRIYGPFDTFSLVNNSVLDQNGQPLSIIYDSTLPGAHPVGAGHYLEIDCWANTVYLDGDVANYKAGLDIPSSDFWFLQHGTNQIQITGGYAGAGAAILWQDAWA